MGIIEMPELEQETIAPVGDEAEAQIAGAVYDDQGTLQPGCMICRATIPAKQAKFRSKVCSDACRYTLRKARQSPGTLETTSLYCQVCRDAIPPATAKKLGVTCGTECRNALRRYRWSILKNQKCPHCLHPSSPAEWEEYRAWRASRGSNVQQFMREPHGLKVRAELRRALVDAVELLARVREGILARYGATSKEGLLAPEQVDQAEWEEERKTQYAIDFNEEATLAGKIREISTLLESRKKLVDASVAE